MRCACARGASPRALTNMVEDGRRLEGLVRQMQYIAARDGQPTEPFVDILEKWRETCEAALVAVAHGAERAR
jgi:hypothetical protein